MQQREERDTIKEETRNEQKEYTDRHNHLQSSFTTKNTPDLKRLNTI